MQKYNLCYVICKSCTKVICIEMQIGGTYVQKVLCAMCYLQKIRCYVICKMTINCYVLCKINGLCYVLCAEKWPRLCAM